ncbi:MAG: hypothetical protein M3Q15_04030 [Pseudomonadota bacterium]|nr:hypothetical protein [Pseudomonadota bacterium]
MAWDRNPWLIVAGLLSLVASLLHLGCIIGGPAWYRFFGAGEGMARAAERGEIYPALVTLAIALLLAIAAAYAFAGAGVIRHPPLIRTALVVITAVYLLRGLALVPIAFNPAAQTPFNIWSSLIVLGYGIFYAVGTWKAWPSLSMKEIA